jgi:hypothetical protein
MPGDITLCQELENLGMEMIPQGSLANLKIDSNLEVQIITAQKEDKGMNTSRRKLLIEHPQTFRWMMQEWSGLKIA